DFVETAFKKNPYHLPTSHLLMNLYAALGNTAQLNTLVDETLARLPQDEVALRFKNGNVQINQSTSIDVGVDESDLSAQKLLNLSLEYYQQQKYEECIKACQEALKLKPDFAEAYNNICSAHNALGNWHLAIEACEEAVRLKPDFQLAINNMNYAKKQLME
ncbi:MAG TPA: tetratricopeptide repeat protein, partial [Saprospiraceae bacterium]|nr:tetratricopeptide repeat protein [Saprospiraceae bacterium]